jgi:hypothetical protein
MYAVGVMQVMVHATRYICGHDVDFLATEPAIYLVEPHRSAALGRQEKLGKNEQSGGGR